MGFNQASGAVRTLRSRAGGILTFFGGMWTDVASAPSVDYTFKPSALFKLTSKELLLLQHGTTWVGIWVCDVFCCC